MPRAYTLIDTHAHIFRADLPMAPGGLHYPKRHFELESFIDVLNAHDVQHACIAAPSFLGPYNDYMIASLRIEKRLRGTVIVEPDINPYILRQMDGDGIVAVRLSLRKLPELPDLRSPEYQRLFRRVADLGWHVQVHIEGERLPQVLPALEDCPASVVVDHFGRPEAAKGVDCDGFQALLRATRRGNIFVKMSAGFRIVCDPGPLAAALLATVGPKRLLWGSDCPFPDFEDRVSYADVIQNFENWVPNMTDRETIAATSRELYRF